MAGMADRSSRKAAIELLQALMLAAICWIALGAVLTRHPKDKKDRTQADPRLFDGGSN